MKHLIIILIATALYSCQYQQPLYIEYAEGERRPVEIIFDWNDCPDAAPKSMSLYLFPLDGSHYTRHEFNNRSGGKILITPGLYAAVALNSDNEQINVFNEGHSDDFRLMIRNANSLSSASSHSEKSEQICPAPEPLWTAWIPEVRISDNKLVVKMCEAFCRYTVDVHRITNPEIVSSVRAIISGNNSAMSFDGPDQNAKSVSLLFNFDPLVGDSVTGRLLTLGHCGLGRSRVSDAQPHNLTLEFTLGDGSMRSTSVDVTNQIHSQPTERCHIVIDSITVPINGSGGMNLTVEEWQTINIAIGAN